MSEAETLKLQGNEAFKAGQMARACELYSKAERTAPNDPVYPSNLSAALYEMGDYAASAEAVLRSSALLQQRPDAKPELIVRLSTRLARALCHGARANTVTKTFLETHDAAIRQLHNLAASKSTTTGGAELSRAWTEWAAVRSEIGDYTEKGAACLSGLSRLPLLCKPLDPTLEFFSIGTDDVIDLTEGWSPRDPYPLHLDKLALDNLSKVSFLFGGVGDGRHVFGTLSGLHAAYKKLPKEKQARFHAHLTLLDIHDATVVRDLTILMLLHCLNNTTDATERAEIKATLMYTFCGVVMPWYCYDRLRAVIMDLRKRLSATPQDLPGYFYVSTDSIPVVLKNLDFWLSLRKSTRRMIEDHQHMSPMEHADAAQYALMPGANPDFKKAYQEKVEAERDAFRRVFLNPTVEDLVKWGFIEEGDDPERAREYIKEHIEDFVDAMHKTMKNGKVRADEEYWYKEFKVFLPPDELRKRHPNFDKAYDQLFSKTGEVKPALRRKVEAHIESEWRPNITMFDLKCADPMVFADTDGYPALQLDMFGTIRCFDEFAHRHDTSGRDSDPQTHREAVAWRICDAFFEEAAAALKALESHITFEFIHGGLSEELAKMRFKGDLGRPKEFPRKYTRMWLSNVPDYTHGPMGMILYVVPNSQEDEPQAAVACNSMFNVGAWAGDEEFIHTYTLLLPEEIPRYLACRVIDSRVVMDVLVLGAMSLPRPLAELATRDEIVTYLTRVLFNTFIPGHSKLRPSHIRLPHNLVAFFGLVMYLHRVGYPGHWLSDFLARVLSGHMVSDVRPYDDFYPIPVSERTRRVPTRKVRTDPWLVEFETIIATAYYAIPFPISSALPAGFSRDAADIAVWEVRVRPAMYFSQHTVMNFSHPRDPRTQLLFWRADVTTATVLIDEMAKIFEGKASPPPGTFFVLTAQEYVQYETRVRFRLSRKRVERMKAESKRWCVIAYRNDTGQQATLPVPVEKWQLYEDSA